MTSHRVVPQAIIISLLIGFLNTYAEKSDTLFIPADTLLKGKFYLADEESKIGWRYHPGDDSLWTFPGFDDSQWNKISPWMSMDKFDVKKWTGVGWFRKVIRIDSSLMNGSMGIYVHHEGSSEIYLNGKKLYTFGEANHDSDQGEICDPRLFPHLIQFDSTTVYTIAVKYSNHKAVQKKYLYEKFFGHIGFSLALCHYSCEIENEINNEIELLSLRWDLTGFYLAFSIIFLLLYFFYSPRKENLYFALFSIGLSLFGIANNLDTMSHARLEVVALYRFLSFLGVSFIFIFFLLFIYEIVYQRIIKVFWLFLIAFCLINLLAFFGSASVFSYIIPLAIIISLLSAESLRVIIIGILKNVRFIWILAAGAIIFLSLNIAGFILFSLLSLTINDTLSNILFIINYMALPISMSIYLAKSYAKTNLDLEEQIRNVKELSIKQIEQERKNAELQLQGELQRAENERKTRELEEARRLQLSLLPKEVPRLPQLDIAAYMKTATEVGGDFYDFHVDDAGILTVIVADATGHGMQAGTMVTATKGLFQNLAAEPDLKKMIQQFNRSLYAMGLQPLLVSLMILRLKGTQLDIVNGGMPGVLIFQKQTNSIQELEAG
ncbi:MAG: SpoIIE family protein phosphatase, partial [bacterium]